MQNLKTEIERDNFIIENLQKNLEEKNMKIKELSSEYNKKRTNSSSSNDSRISSPSSKLVLFARLYFLFLAKKIVISGC